MVRDDNETARLFSGWFNAGCNPVNQFILQLAVTADAGNIVNYWNVRQDGDADRIVSSVYCDIIRQYRF